MAEGALSRAPLVLAVVLGVLVLYVTIVSGLAHTASQHSMFSSFRSDLAQGTAPVDQTDGNGHLLAPGAPVAILRIPSIGVDEVVGEGTTGEILTHGPGHLRATVLPGEAGTSQVFGRAATYGGPFGSLSSLRRGATLTTITGLGSSTFKVIDVRRAGDPVPAPVASGGARLTLLTADGTPFVPSGVVRVDADLVGNQAQVSSLLTTTLSPSELAMGTDSSTVWQLVLWLEALVLLTVGATLAWLRWGRAQAWITFTAPLLLVAYFIADQTTRLLPNML